MAYARNLAIALLPLTLMACAGAAVSPAARDAATVPATPSAEEDARSQSPYGLFLAGQAAFDGGHSDAAARYFSRAAAQDASAPVLQTQAFTAALLAGDVAKAAALAPHGPQTDAMIERLGALTQGVEELAEGHAREARKIFTSAVVGAPHNSAAALLAPFAAAAAGDAEGSIVRPVIPNEPLSNFFASLDQGRLYERAGRFDEAETDYRSLIGTGDAGGVPSVALGELLERRGRQNDALAIYNQALAKSADDGALLTARARVLAHGKPPSAPTLRQDAAEALIAQSTELVMQKQQEGALAYLRLALRLDPDRGEAWTMVGDILSTIGDPEGARAAYLQPRPGADQYAEARDKLAWSYQTAGDKPMALKIARETVATAPESREAAITLADLLRADEEYADSISILDRLIAAKDQGPDWRLLYMRAASLEESGRWADSERDLSAALKLRPDEPELLNFLGYSWIDRGINLQQALAMVQKAVDQDPQNGAMLDSLGWGYYRLGNYKTAVEKLEAAVILDAADPDVNNHLGDAYWRVGRRTEAQFQWNRVLTLDPPAKLRAEVEGKLKSGLDGAARPSVVAGS
jgi:Flp pilus assembly protein TadD